MSIQTESIETLTIPALVRRLAALPLPFGADPSTLGKELVTALKTRARDLEHARRIVERILETAETCPTPAQLAAVAANVDPDNGRMPPACKLCLENGGYYVHTERIIGSKRVNFSGRCQCPRGRFLAAKDRENEKSI